LEKGLIVKGQKGHRINVCVKGFVLGGRKSIKGNQEKKRLQYLESHPPPWEGEKGKKERE